MLDRDPKKGDKIVWDGIEYDVIDFIPVEPMVGIRDGQGRAFNVYTKEAKKYANFREERRDVEIIKARADVLKAAEAWFRDNHGLRHTMNEFERNINDAVYNLLSLERR